MVTYQKRSFRNWKAYSSVESGTKISKKLLIRKYNMDPQVYLEPVQGSLYSELIMISSDEEETFSDGFSIIS